MTIAAVSVWQECERRQRIVLLADAHVELEGLRSAIADEGFMVVLANDGASALSLATRRRPDAIVADAHLRGVGGFGLLARLRSADATQHTPILLLFNAN